MSGWRFSPPASRSFSLLVSVALLTACGRPASESPVATVAASAPATLVTETRVTVTRTSGQVDRGALPVPVGTGPIFARLLETQLAPAAATLADQKERWLAAFGPGGDAPATLAAAWETFRVGVPAPRDVTLALPDGRQQQFPSDPELYEEFSRRMTDLNPDYLAEELRDLASSAISMAARRRGGSAPDESPLVTAQREAEADWLDALVDWVGGFGPWLLQQREARQTRAAAQADWARYAENERLVLLAHVEAATLDRVVVAEDGSFRLAGAGLVVLEIAHPSARLLLAPDEADPAWLGLPPTQDQFEVSARAAAELASSAGGRVQKVPAAADREVKLLAPAAAIRLIPRLVLAQRLRAAAAADVAPNAEDGPAATAATPAPDRWLGVPAAQRRALEQRLVEIRQAVPAPFPVSLLDERGRAQEWWGGGSLAAAWGERLETLTWDNLATRVPQLQAELEREFRQRQQALTRGEVAAAGQADLAWLGELHEVLLAAERLVRRDALARLQADQRVRAAAAAAAGDTAPTKALADLPAGAVWATFQAEHLPDLRAAVAAAVVASLPVAGDGTVTPPGPGLLVLPGDPDAAAEAPFTILGLDEPTALP